MRYSIKIDGDPIYKYTDRESKTRMWTSFKEQRIRWIITLETQFEDNPITSKSLDLELHVYCRHGFSSGRLSSYAKFIENICMNRIFSSLDIINSFVVYKHMVKNDPYTIFTIKEN